MNSLVSNISFAADILLALFYCRPREHQMVSLPRRIAGMVFLLLTYILYPSSVFSFLSNSATRYIVRTVLTAAFIALSRRIDWLTAAYGAAYWSAMHLLVRNIFFAPATYAVMTGTANFTGNAVVNGILCALLTNLIMAAVVLLYDRVTPLLDMSPIDKTRVLLLALIVVIGIYTKELAVPLRNMGSSAMLELSLCFVVLQGALLLLLLFIERNRRQQREKAAAELQNQAASALLKSIREQQESAQNVRQLRHDLKNHMLAVRLLLQQQDSAAAEDYISKFINQAAAPAAVYHTGSDLLDGLLAVKLAPAAAEKVKVEASLDFSAGSFLSDFDLCVIMGSILDNAVEACGRVSPEKPRHITLSGGVSAGCLVVRLENSCAAVPALLNGLPPTIKADTYMHGFGLKNVRRTLETYGGELSISTETEGLFVLTILIPLAEQK